MFLPSRVTIMKYAEINAPVEKVMNEIVDFNNWKDWYPALKNHEMDIHINPASASNLSSATLQDKSGKSIMLALTDTAQQIIDIHVITSSSTRVNYQFVLHTDDSKHKTDVTWSIRIDFGIWPWKRVQGILVEKFSAPQYEAAIQDLKNAVEK